MKASTYINVGFKPCIQLYTRGMSYQKLVNACTKKNNTHKHAGPAHSDVQLPASECESMYTGRMHAQAPSLDAAFSNVFSIREGDSCIASVVMSWQSCVCGRRG